MSKQETIHSIFESFKDKFYSVSYVMNDVRRNFTGVTEAEKHNITKEIMAMLHEHQTNPRPSINDKPVTEQPVMNEAALDDEDDIEDLPDIPDEDGEDEASLDDEAIDPDAEMDELDDEGDDLPLDDEGDDVDIDIDIDAEADDTPSKQYIMSPTEYFQKMESGEIDGTHDVVKSLDDFMNINDADPSAIELDDFDTTDDVGAGAAVDASEPESGDYDIDAELGIGGGGTPDETDDTDDSSDIEDPSDEELGL